jgi:hypothetical protein
MIAWAGNGITLIEVLPKHVKHITTQMNYITPFLIIFIKTCIKPPTTGHISAIAYFITSSV